MKLLEQTLKQQETDSTYPGQKLRKCCISRNFILPISKMTTKYQACPLSYSLSISLRYPPKSILISLFPGAKTNSASASVKKCRFVPKNICLSLRAHWTGHLNVHMLKQRGDKSATHPALSGPIEKEPMDHGKSHRFIGSASMRLAL